MVVVTQSYGLNFPSAITLAGQNVAFNGANSAPYRVIDKLENSDDPHSFAVYP